MSKYLKRNRNKNLSLLNETKASILFVLAVCLMTLPIISGCSFNLRNNALQREQNDIPVNDLVERENGYLAKYESVDSEYLETIYPGSNGELRELIYYKDKIIDSLYTKIDYLFFRVDSLKQELIYYDGKVTVNTEFEIPKSFQFADRTFDLSNERVYDMFSEIFEHELKAAYRYIPRSGMYFPLFESVFESYGIPEDMKYLAIAESGLASSATSPVGAGGIWQFMPATARQYKLKIDSFVDERRNIFKATDAAARYLSNSYDNLSRLGAEDWLLTMCAYNAGQGSVTRVMREQQAHDFFDLIMRVDETNKYVWRSAAIKLIFENEKTLFGSEFEREPSILDVTRRETISLKGHHKIDEWVKAQGTVLRRVWELNPWLNIYQRRRGRYSAINDIVLPAGEYEILLPIDSEPNETLVAQAERAFHSRNSGYYTYHTVRRGDTLFGIAKRYGVSVVSIRNANNLRSDIIRPGQRLQLFGAAGGVTASTSLISTDTYTVRRGDSLSLIATRSGTTVAEIKSLNGLSNDVIQPGQVLKLTTETNANISTQEYIVKSGDTLSKIAQNYNTTTNSIIRLNGLSSSLIRIGQRLKVPAQSGGGNVYIVQNGDSIEIIAQKLKTSSAHLISRNNLTVQNRGDKQVVIIQPGQRLQY